MLPSKIVGSVITRTGAVPFLLDGAAGTVELGRFEAAHPMQASLGGMERQAVERQVKSEVTGARSVRIGEYACPLCGRWVDVVRKPDEWAGDRCRTCE